MHFIGWAPNGMCVAFRAGEILSSNLSFLTMTNVQFHLLKTAASWSIFLSLSHCHLGNHFRNCIVCACAFASWYVAMTNDNLILSTFHSFSRYIPIRKREKTQPNVWYSVYLNGIFPSNSVHQPHAIILAYKSMYRNRVGHMNGSRWWAHQQTDTHQNYTEKMNMEKNLVEIVIIWFLWFLSSHFSYVIISWLYCNNCFPNRIVLPFSPFIPYHSTFFGFCYVCIYLFGA